MRRDALAADTLMPWVRFTGNFDWKPTLKVMFAYRKGSIHLVHSKCYELAIKAGKAVPIERPPKKEKPCHQET